MSLLGAAAVAASVILLRSQKDEPQQANQMVPAGESVPGEIHVDRLRELGL